MTNGRIAPAGLITYIRIYLQHRDLQSVTAKFSGNRTAYNAASYDQHIILIHHCIPPFILCIFSQKEPGKSPGSEYLLSISILL